MSQHQSGQVCTLVFHVRYDDTVTDSDQLATFFDKRLRSTPANEQREAGILQLSPPLCESQHRKYALFNRDTHQLHPETFDSVSDADRRRNPALPLTIVSFAWEPDGREAKEKQVEH